MKVLRTSNFDKDDYNEAFVTLEGKDTFLSYHAAQLAELLNNMEHQNSPHYYKIVEDGYVLRKREP